MGEKREERKVVSIILFAIIIVILGIIVFKKPSITGKVVGKETIFSENLNIQKNESSIYEWQVKNPGSVKAIKATGSVSANGTARVYIEKKNGERRLLFDSTKHLFDVDIDVLPEYKKILQGEKILIQNILYNLRGFGAGNVNVKYSIKDDKGNVIATQEETVYIETQATFIRELVIPEEIKAGTYIAFVEATSNSTIVGTGSDTFEVKAKFEEPFYKQLRYYMIGLAVAIAFVIILVIGAYGIQILRRKKEIKELRAKEPMERVRKLEEELRALETAYKSGFISKESYEKDKKRIQDRLDTLKKSE